MWVKCNRTELLQAVADVEGGHIIRSGDGFTIWETKARVSIAKIEHNDPDEHFLWDAPEVEEEEEEEDHHEQE